jgi:hypothetical protein
MWDVDRLWRGGLVIGEGEKRNDRQFEEEEKKKRFLMTMYGISGVDKVR